MHFDFIDNRNDSNDNNTITITITIIIIKKNIYNLSQIIALSKMKKDLGLDSPKNQERYTIILLIKYCHNL